MSRFGTCPTGCSEQRLELVRANAYDTVGRLAAGAADRVDAMRELLAALDAPPEREEWVDAYRALQGRAHELLAQSETSRPDEAEEPEPAETTVTWWCADCGGLDAPQPCLGICIWHEIDWVTQDLYEQRRAELQAIQETERRLLTVVRHLAWVTPRPGRWERTWHALHAAANAARDDSRGMTEP